jgi:DNA-directed RNA polymerase specialized sigma24 family protein
MNSNDDLLSSTASASSTVSPVTSPGARPPDAPAKVDTPAAGNDNAARVGTRDTTPLVARPEVVRCIRATLLRYRVRQRDLADAIADVQAEAIVRARARRMPASVAQWKALARKIAIHRSLNRLRDAKRRRRYDTGLCEDPDAYLRPTLHWEHRDPVDTKRFLAVLKDLFDSGQMPEHGAEILWGEAEKVPHAEIARELGLSTTAVDNRLSRMRAKFRARLGALGMLALLLLVFTLPPPVGEVATPPPQTAPTPEMVPPPQTEPTPTMVPAEPAPQACNVSASDGGTPSCAKNRPLPSEEIAPMVLK